MRTIWKELIYGGHFQCLGLVGIAYVSSFVIGLEASWQFLLLTYLIFYPIYIYNRFRGIKIDEATNPERTKHFQGYLSIMPKLIVVSMVLLIALLINIGNPKLSIFSLALLFLGLLYPVYFKNLTQKIVAFKNYYVSAFFAVIAVVPVIFHGYELDSLAKIGLFFLIIFIFLKTMLMQILLDCKDIEGDRPLSIQKFSLSL